jgi:prepilin-type N-terminal cleavage/methylation domain-containing protein
MKNNNGFTLIELTVVLIITGLIVAGASHAFYLWLVQHRLDVTKQRMAAIEAALVKHVQENGDLPCAAPRVDRSDPGYGRESDCSGAAPTGTAQTAGSGGRNVRIGAVPVRTLDLSDEHRLDGWYSSFTYAVTEVLASDNPLFDINLGAISIIDENGASVITPDGSALYAVVSHGYEGDCASGMDAENCNDDDTFRAAPFSTGDNTGFFDDFIAFATDIEGSTISNMERCSDSGMLFAPSDPAADAQGCVFVPSLADMSCPAGEAMIGFIGGTLQCAAVGGGGGPPPSCPPGQTWNGTVCVSPPPPNLNCNFRGTSIANGQCECTWGYRCIAGAAVLDPTCWSTQCS